MTERREIKQRSPAVWERVKAAYLAGEPANSVARRFDVGYGNLRYRAHAEDWTRKAALIQADAVAVEEAVRLDGRVDEVALFTAPTGDPEPFTPRAAHRRAIARASALLAAGRAVEATAMLKAAESLARLTGDDGDDDGPLNPETDAAREAAARKGWENTLDLIEAQADALARRILAETPGAPAVHSGFVHAWRAQYLGPEVAAHDRAAMQDRAAHRVAFHWHDDGQPLPVDEVRAMYYGVFRRQIRAKAGLPALGPGEGE